MHKVAIILVNYGDYAEKYLQDCYASLQGQKLSSGTFKIYLVDNAASQKSQEYLNKFENLVNIPRVDGNYCAANNAGIRTAIADNCDLFVIVNMDTVFAENWLEELVTAIDSDVTIGLVQSKILQFGKEISGQPVLNNIGNEIHYLGHGYSRGNGMVDTEIDNGLMEIGGYISGCSYIISGNLLKKINFYNEEYYMYLDDLEISWKAKLLGYKLVINPKSIVYHKYCFDRSAKMIYYMERNRYLAIFTFYKLATLILILPALIAMELGIIIFSLVNHWFDKKIAVYRYFLNLQNIKKILKIRRDVQALRTIDDRELLAGSVGKIEFQEINNFLLKYIGNPILNLYWLIIKKVIIW